MSLMRSAASHCEMLVLKSQVLRATTEVDLYLVLFITASGGV